MKAFELLDELKVGGTVRHETCDTFKVGLLLVAIFPLVGCFLERYMKAYFRKLNIKKDE